MLRFPFWDRAVGTGCPIVQALSFFEGGPRAMSEEVTGALVANDAQWAERLRLLRADSYHWDDARVRAPLVDLRRLAVEIAFRTTTGGPAPFPWPEGGGGLTGDLERFVAALAEEIARLRTS